MEDLLAPSVEDPGERVAVGRTRTSSGSQEPPEQGNVLRLDTSDFKARVSSQQ